MLFEFSKALTHYGVSTPGQDHTPHHKLRKPDTPDYYRLAPKALLKDKHHEPPTNV